MAKDIPSPASLAAAAPAADEHFPPRTARQLKPCLLPGRSISLYLTQRAKIDERGCPPWVISYHGISSSDRLPTMPGWKCTLVFSLSSAGGDYRPPFFLALENPVTQDKDGVWRFFSDSEMCQFTVFTPSETCRELKITCFTSRWVAIQLVR